MLVALTRRVPPSITRCELTHVARTPIDPARADDQHRRYEEALRDAGCRIERVAPEPDLPDSVFVEDTAVVVDEIAAIARPGAASRRPETASVAEALMRFRRIEAIEQPGTLDGGDVLVIGHTVYVGIGGRTNADGARQLEQHLAPHGYGVLGVRVDGCLHLKSAVTRVAARAVLVNPEWIDPAAFGDMERIEVDPLEPLAANALLVGETLLCSPAYPRTRARLESRGVQVTPVDLSELAKAEGALTCCSIILDDQQ